MRTWVLVYDISDNRLRQRVAKRVARDGVRVQESVFEVVARTDAGFQRLLRDLRALLDGSDDAQVRWYGMNLDGYARSGAIGSAPPTPPPAVILE
jgi:CRISPR-associated endonuclease Cas2